MKTLQKEWIRGGYKRLNIIWSSDNGMVYVVKINTSNGNVYEVHHKRVTDTFDDVEKAMRYAKFCVNRG